MESGKWKVESRPDTLVRLGFLASLVVLTMLALPAIGQDQPAPATAPAGPTMSIDDAIATAVQHSPGLAIARERVDRAKNQIREARAQYLPHVNLTANRVYTRPVSSFTFDGPSGPIKIQTVIPAQTSAGATLNQPIDITRRISLGNQLAKLGLDIQNYTEAQTLQQLIANVKSGYYSVLRAQGGVDTAQAAVRAADERLRLAQAQFAAGVSPKFDVTQAEVDVTNLRQTLIQAQNGVAVAKAALNRTLGLDAGRPFEAELQAGPVSPVTIDIPANTQKALAARPEMLQARTNVDLFHRNIKFTSTENKPSVALFTSANHTAVTSTFNPNKTQYMYGAQAAWSIWDGGVTKARVEQAKNDYRIAQSTLDQTKLGVELDVRTAALSLMESSRRVGSAEANVTQAEEALRLSRVRYQAGVTTGVEVINAESALTQARTNAVNARYDYLNNVAQLERATASQPEYAKLTSAAPITAVPEVVDK